MNIVIKAQTYNLQCFATPDKGNLYSNAKRIVFAIHGYSRNANDYFNYVSSAATVAAANRDTIVVAPMFTIQEDISALSLPQNTLKWSNHGWKIGNKSQDSAGISSFAIFEQVIYQFTTRLPNLRMVIISGHSAGGQFVQRFAAGNSIEDTFPGLGFRYIVMNPSSYLYFTADRIQPKTSDSFKVPHTRCTNYNDYKYGIQKLASCGYMDAVGSRELLTRYRRRNVSYILGREDIEANYNLDISDAAMLQGRNRLERGLIFYKYLVYLFGIAITQQHKQVVVPGVGHNAKDMYHASSTLHFLFSGGSEHPYQQAAVVSGKQQHASMRMRA